MSDIKAGDTFEFDYPFYEEDMGLFNGKKQSWICPGCHRSEEEDGSGYGVDIYWTANYEGKIVYEVLCIAEMPGRYQDRIIVKYHYIKPDGEKYNSPKVKTFTATKFKSQVDRETVFPCDYEVDSSYK